MGKGERRKRDQALSKLGHPIKNPHHICILHSMSKTDDQFTSLSSIKRHPEEQLSHLLNIRDKRLNEPVDSPYQMKAVCDLLRETLNDADLGTTGYHTKCYLKFTSKLHRLKSRQVHHQISPLQHPVILFKRLTLALQK